MAAIGGQQAGNGGKAGNGGNGGSVAASGSDGEPKRKKGGHGNGKRKSGANGTAWRPEWVRKRWKRLSAGLPDLAADGGKGDLETTAARARDKQTTAPRAIDRLHWFVISRRGGDAEAGIPPYQSGRTEVEQALVWGMSPETLRNDAVEALHFLQLDMDPAEERTRLFQYIEAGCAKASREANGSRTYIEAARLAADILGIIKQNVDVRLDVSSVFQRMAQEAEPPPILTSGASVPELPEAEQADPFESEATPEPAYSRGEPGRLASK